MADLSQQRGQGPQSTLWRGLRRQIREAGFDGRTDSPVELKAAFAAPATGAPD